MNVTSKEAKEIIEAYEGLIGAPFLLSNGNEMYIQEFRLLTHASQKGNPVTYSIIALLQNPDYNSNVQFYVSFESIIAQLEVPMDTDEY